MNTVIRSIIDSVNYDTNCKGLQAKETATELIKILFASENISFEGWKVVEIPLVDDSGKYPVAVVVCIYNADKKIELSINLTADGIIFDVGEDDTTAVKTISEAIKNYTMTFREMVERQIEKRDRQTINIYPVGIVRRMNDNQLIIPKVLRQSMGINENDPIEFFTSPEGYICIKKYNPEEN
jgi:hypothetical protein